MRIVVIAVACSALLAGCARHTWIPGPAAQIKDFEMQKAQCSLMARSGTSGYVASGTPGEVIGGTVGYAIGSGIRTQADFNDCMAASGWKVADETH